MEILVCFSGMTLSTVKGVIFNLVHLIYVGRCYYKPKCLYRHKYSFPSRTPKCFLYIKKYIFSTSFIPVGWEYLSLPSQYLKDRFSYFSPIILGMKKITILVDNMPLRNTMYVQFLNKL
jgi:hypothetical protein